MNCRSYYLSATALLALCSLLLCGSAQAQLSYNALIISGAPVPDGDGSFVGPSAGLLNDAGQILFNSFLSDASSDYGIFRADASGKIVRIVRKGQIEPKGAGRPFSAFSAITSFNEPGQLAFVGYFDNTTDGTTDHGLFLSNGENGISEVARRGTSAPDNNGELHSFNEFALNNAGSVAFRATLSGTSGGDGDSVGVYIGSATGAPLQVARTGQTSLDGNGNYTRLYGVEINDPGQVLFHAGVGNPVEGVAADSAVMLRDTDGTTRQIVRNGQSLMTDGTAIHSGSAALNNLGEVSFYSSYIDANNAEGKGIFLANDTGDISQVASLGMRSHNTGEAIRDISSLSPLLNDTGQVLFSGTLEATVFYVFGEVPAPALLLGDGLGGLTEIVRAGQVTPDGGRYFPHQYFDNRTINDNGQVAFTATTELPGGSSSLGLYFFDDNNGLLSVAQIGGPFMGSTISSLSFAGESSYGKSGLMGLNGIGQIAFGFSLADGRSGLAVASLVPEPSTAMLALLSTIGFFSVISRSKRTALTHQGCVALAVIAGSSALMTQDCQAASFTGIGDLSGGDFNSRASSISADGSVVVGTSKSANGPEIFRWTSEGGMTSLGSLPNTSSISAKDVSSDGTVLVGSRFLPSFEQESIVAENGLGGLGIFLGFENFANGVSADGSIVVGGKDSTLGFEAFSLDRSGIPLPVALGDLPGGNHFSIANGISANGSVIVGHSSSAASSSSSQFAVEAFRWTSTGGMVGLGHLPGGDFDSVATGVSSDGTVIIGRSESTSGTEGFRWTSGGGMIGLGDLAGGSFDSIASAASSDGSIIVGQSDSANGFEAFIWDGNNGLRSLRELLINDHNLDLTGWELWESTGVSDDGKTIVGRGSNPDGNQEGWVVNLNPSASLPGDFDGDGDVDGNDYNLWASTYGDSVVLGSGADGNSNGIIDAADYTVWRDNQTAATSNAVPEPSALALILLGYGIAVTRRF